MKNAAPRSRPWNDRLAWLFYLIFWVSFLCIIISIFFNFQVYQRFFLLLIPITAAACLLLATVYRTIGRHEAFFSRHYKTVLLCFLGILFLLHLIFGEVFRFDPIYDMKAIYQNALDWVETGSFAQSYYPTLSRDYFYIYPNNLGSMAFLAAVFKAARLLGVEDTFRAAALVNSCLILCTVALTSLICKKLWGVRQGIMALALFALSPPIYFSSAVFYTDFLSIIFPVLSFYLFLLGMESIGRKKRLLWLSLSCLVLAVGSLIKITVLITLIAMALYCIRYKKFRRALFLTAAGGLLAAAVTLSFQGYLYSHHLDREKAEEMNTPYTHWFMMGLSGNGGYNNKDDSFTHSISDPQERREAIEEKIKERLGEMGISGLAGLWWTKSGRCFGDGTYALSEFLDDNPQHWTIFHELVLYQGKLYPIYDYLCTSLFTAILIFMTASALLNLRRRGNFSPPDTLLPLLCVFGIMLFLLCWEAKSRYIINFIPMIFIGATGGLEGLYRMIPGGLSSLLKKNRGKTGGLN